MVIVTIKQKFNKSHNMYLGDYMERRWI